MSPLHMGKLRHGEAGLLTHNPRACCYGLDEEEQRSSLNQVGKP